MPSDPFVSIIILNYNGRKWLDECFQSLSKLRYPQDRYEVILGDNASTDDSVEYTKENYPWVRVHSMGKIMASAKAIIFARPKPKGIISCS